ncbi:hypothetical protein [Bradyrhizobium sp. G127]|uniref:hypothetical protein n=1 Tax=Bradyrhizobium sp. G127 TaxID=2904800 RepID=UPI001F372CBD|nr:hypothetical protein [Bradyrhizobium sp. G127]MCF2523904.1 hypothetical protein [Bradyrhizobium sp. G127]
MINAGHTHTGALINQIRAITEYCTAPDNEGTHIDLSEIASELAAASEALYEEAGRQLTRTGVAA